jgi:hypothetical protein
VSECRSPRWVMRQNMAHCFEGSLFAAAALRYLGFKPLVVDMMAENDDDHVIAVFHRNGCWGAVAKSNFTTLRYREPVYRTIRELVMSYFDFYFNTLGDKSLRSYSRPVNLSRFDNHDWMTTEADLEFIGDHLNTVRHYKVLTPAMIRSLAVADDVVMNASLNGALPEGLFKPKERLRIGSKSDMKVCASGRPTEKR